MKSIAAAYVLRYSPDQAGDQFPWHWYAGRCVADLHRCSSHSTEADAFEYLAEVLGKAARVNHELSTHYPNGLSAASIGNNGDEETISSQVSQIQVLLDTRRIATDLESALPNEDTEADFAMETSDAASLLLSAFHGER